MYFVIGVVSLVLISCTKDVESRPNYIFKPAPNENVAAKIGDREITFQEVYSGIESEIHEAKRQVYELKMNRLQAIVLEKIMSDDPRKEGMTNDQFLEKYILQDANITEADIQSFIAQRNLPQEQITDEVRERIRQFILMEKKKEMVDIWLAKKTADNPIEVYFERPQRPVFDVNPGDSPYKGRSDAAITIVEFSDFQCPFCSQGAEVMREVKNKYGDKIRIVFKNFPLPFHQHAKEAAQAALCARDQDDSKFWDMHKAMFANQSNLNRDGLIKKANSIGLKSDEFTECLNSQKFLSAVERDIQEGARVGVQSTPTYYVNGMLVSGAQPLQSFSEIIEEILNR